LCAGAAIISFWRGNIRASEVMFMHISFAILEDAPAISRLIGSLARFFTLQPDGAGAEDFLKAISPDAVAGYLADPRFTYFKAVDNDALAGVVAVRDGSHLYHLFVDASFQRRGLSRLLWDHARAAVGEANPGYFTVNSTPYAQPVYERFGFVATGPRVETKGIAFVPMRWVAA
jgi:GNAT superfamily N-acetyltransferase